MSAYALSFASFLPPVGTSNTNSSLQLPIKCENQSVKAICCSNTSQTSNESMECCGNSEPFSTNHVGIKSATINAGALVRPKRKNSQVPINVFSLPDDAVLFKLSINFNGRKYTATRSFETFVKFKRDLGKELSNLNNRQSNKCGTINKSESVVVLPKLPECISDQPNADETFGQPKISTKFNTAMAATSYQNASLSGFTKIQSLLWCYYCPLVENWLKQVIKIKDVETSTSLNNFLWEPLRDDDSIPSMSCGSTVSSITGSSIRSHNSSIGSTISLSSIHEDYNLDSDCDEE